ncbi:MAG: hypothetical protein HYY17_08315 [Planctomycetes bacterium]|nr:hypothetical protein [Planctomycetota bacterium]
MRQDRVRSTAWFALMALTLAAAGMAGCDGDDDDAVADVVLRIFDDSPEPGGNDVGYAVAIDAAGRIVAAGSADIAGNGADIAVWRFNPDGSRDTTFNAGGATPGIFTHHNAAGGSGNDRASAVAVDGQGRILVAGVSFNGANDDMVLMRLTPAGTLDTADFNSALVEPGGPGFVIRNNSGGDGATDIVLGSGGIIYLSGYTGSGGMDLAVWAYQENGTRDVAWDTDGLAVVDASGFLDYGSSIAFDKSGRIVVAGITASGAAAGTRDIAIWRFLSTGSLDPAFGTGGLVTIVDPAGGAAAEDRAWGVAIDGKGRVLVTGSSYLPGGVDRVMVVVRHTNESSGPGFTQVPLTEIVVLPSLGTTGQPPLEGWSIAVDGQERIVVAGEAGSMGGTQLAVVRLNGDGTLDGSFAGGGVFVDSRGLGSGDRGFGLAIDGNGRPVVVGESSNGTDLDLGLWRIP